MYRYIIGMFLGVYIDQNYNLPKVNVYIDKFKEEMKSLEENSRRKNG